MIIQTLNSIAPRMQHSQRAELQGPENKCTLGFSLRMVSGVQSCLWSAHTRDQTYDLRKIGFLQFEEITEHSFGRRS